MKNKRIFMYIIIILIILFVLWMGILVINNRKSEQKKALIEYTPEIEITDEQLRSTNITLYFYSEEEGILKQEIRQIDSKELLENPERKLIEYLIAGPKDSNLTNLIPKKTELINVEKIKENLIIDFSKDFIEDQNLGMEKEEYIIESILKTVSQLNEINGIKILIDGEENKAFPDNGISFEEIFTTKK